MVDSTSVLSAARDLTGGAQADVATRRRAALEFEKMVLYCDEPAATPAMAALVPQLQLLNQLYEQFETELELEFADQLLSSTAHIEQYALYRRFVTLISNEVALAGIKSGDRIAMIGSGPFPISSILLFKLFQIRVIAVERNARSADLSRRVIEKLGLENGIEIATNTGQDLESLNVTAAIIALLAKPKDLILHNIFTQHSSCQRIVCRTSHGLRQALYEPTDPAILHRYQLRAQHIADGDQTISSLLLERRAI